MIEDFIVVSEVDNGPAFAEPIFQRKFKLSVPDFPHHIVTFYRKSWDCFIPMSYLHIRPMGDIHLVGCDAYFGYCGDPRAYEIDLQAGFVSTEHDKLLAHWHKPLTPERRSELLKQALSLVPF
jgi:hypothetical protein